MITQEELKSLLSYNPETGIFRWRVSRNGTGGVGSNAGCPHPNGYQYIKIDGISYSAHRLAWLYETGEFPSEHIDHINGIKNNNNILNLREATRSENMRNRKKNANTKSGVKGVDEITLKDGTTVRYVARTRSNGKRKHIGTYNTIELASAAYEVYCQNNYGEFYQDPNKKEEIK